MISCSIIPVTIDTSSEGLVQVTYPSGVKVESGKELTPTQVKDEPTVSWEAEDNALYALFMVDPDAPSRAEPTNREILHWSGEGRVRVKTRDSSGKYNLGYPIAGNFYQVQYDYYVPILKAQIID
ncbi:phosphatidylethanolamine-binding protein homolog F40A3.3-like [Bactrocera oleae]|uniref:phosphatidylethanolamine-binding protein homolog F40A3.3-like n=1 Tax=Bactrocera oleae TaxID=104688 RepID=UPI00387ECBFB